MPKTRAEVESDPEFQKLSPQARERVLARLSESPASSPAVTTGSAEAPMTNGTSMGANLMSMLNRGMEAQAGATVGGLKGIARSVIGAGQLINKIPFPGTEEKQAEDARLLQGAADEFASPEGTAENLGFAGEQVAEFIGTMLATRGQGGGPAGARLAASAGRVRQGLQPLVRAVVGGAKGAAEGGAVRGVQTGGDPAQTATAAALGGVVPAAVEGVARPVARAISPHVISKVIGATPKSFPKEGRKVLEGARGVAMDLLRHGPVNSRDEFLRLASRRLEFVTSQIERAKGRGAVPGQGIVPRALQEAQEHTQLLVDGLTQAIQKGKAKGLPDLAKMGVRSLPAVALGLGVGPGAAAAGVGTQLAVRGAQTPRIATRIARFGLELGSSRPSNAHLRLPGVPPVMARGSGRTVGETANVVGQRQISEAEVTALEAFSKAKNLTPEGQAAHRTMRTKQIRSVMQEEGLSESESSAAEALYFQNGDITLQEAIDAVLRRR